jgi:hypothetical protein
LLQILYVTLYNYSHFIRYVNEHYSYYVFLLPPLGTINRQRKTLISMLNRVNLIIYNGHTDKIKTGVRSPILYDGL